MVDTHSKMYLHKKLYFEHADKYGPLLNLKVAQKKTAAGPVSMVSGLVLLLSVHQV